jgi:hypothetical protein
MIGVDLETGPTRTDNGISILSAKYKNLNLTGGNDCKQKLVRNIPDTNRKSPPISGKFV